MNYPIAIHKDSDYGVTVPDLPGCFSAGKTIDDAVAMAKEAIELHIEGLIEEGEVVPEPSDIQAHQDHPDYRGAVWAIVSINPSDLRIRAKRINITMPERVLDAVDRFARSHNETRSGLLTKAVNAYIHGRADGVRAKTSRQAHRAAISGRSRRGRRS